RVVITLEQSSGAFRILLAKLRRADEIDEEHGRQLALSHRLRGERRRTLQGRLRRLASHLAVDLERRVVAQDRLLEIVQRATRFEPELVNERPAGVLVGGERLGLTAGTVERNHQLGPQLFTQRMVGDERLELADQTGVPSKSDLGLDPFLERVEMEL